jgi:hypothetical protein
MGGLEARAGSLTRFELALKGPFRGNGLKFEDGVEG